MFERFTERNRQVVILAQDEARAMKHNYIGTEHLLLGLLREEEGLAAAVLNSLDITVEEVRQQVLRIVGQGDEAVSGQVPFTPRAKKVLELALREALSLGHNYIGTEHTLLGLVRENEGVAARILLDFDADAEKIRNEVIRNLSRPGKGKQDPVTVKVMSAWEKGLQKTSTEDLMAMMIKTLNRVVDILERKEDEKKGCACNNCNCRNDKRVDSDGVAGEEGLN